MKRVRGESERRESKSLRKSKKREGEECKERERLREKGIE
jgi:hypothetical protein